MISLMNLTVAMTIEGLSYIEVMIMGAIRWGTRGTCPPHFFRRGDI